MKFQSILNFAGCLALAVILSWFSNFFPWRLHAVSPLTDEPRNVSLTSLYRLSDIEQHDWRHEARRSYFKRALRCRDIPGHPFSGIFELCNFPGSNDQSLTNDEQFAGVIMLEAFRLLWLAHLMMQNMQAHELSVSFRRYFRDEDYDTVKQLFSDITSQLGLNTGMVLDPNWSPQCVPQPQLLPLKIFYKYARKDQETYCEQHPGTSAFIQTLPYNGAPANSQSVPQYIVLCPAMLTSSSYDPVMRAPPRDLDQVDIPQLVVDSFASARGYGQSFPRGGMMTSSTHIAHELIHWWNVYWPGIDPIFDQPFTPAGWSKEIKAYTAWQCQELRRVKPELCKVNDSNYQWFMLEIYWTADVSSKLGYTPEWQDTPQDFTESDF